MNPAKVGRVEVRVSRVRILKFFVDPVNFLWKLIRFVVYQ